uniref:Small nuclear RNA activating complex polypeptide 2 n=1 Tax=Myotis lucifugus TaxID=59463 RepID=G1Q4U5_MYOLU
TKAAPTHPPPGARYGGDVARGAVWSALQKRQLLRLLQTRRGPEPDVAELAGERGRREAEIRDFLQQLKNPVAREAIQKVHPGGLKGPRHRETQPPAPIEVWMDLAKKVTGPLEEALTVAFSQALTIMAVEPVSLLYSNRPSQRRHMENYCPLTPTPSRQENLSPEAAGPTPEAAAGRSAEGDLEVDFEKIYKYLSSISHSCHGPALSPAESAVVLHLLMSHPEELSHLPCADLVEHMMDTYPHLMPPPPVCPQRWEAGTRRGGLGPTSGPQPPALAAPALGDYLPPLPRDALPSPAPRELPSFCSSTGLLSQSLSPLT